MTRWRSLYADGQVWLMTTEPAVFMTVPVAKEPSEFSFKDRSKPNFVRQLHEIRQIVRAMAGFGGTALTG